MPLVQALPRQIPGPTMGNTLKDGAHLKRYAEMSGTVLNQIAKPHRNHRCGLIESDLTRSRDWIGRITVVLRATQSERLAGGYGLPPELPDCRCITWRRDSNEKPPPKGKPIQLRGCRAQPQLPA